MAPVQILTFEKLWYRFCKSKSYGSRSGSTTLLYLNDKIIFYRPMCSALFALPAFHQRSSRATQPAAGRKMAYMYKKSSAARNATFNVKKNAATERTRARFCDPKCWLREIYMELERLWPFDKFAGKRLRTIMRKAALCSRLILPFVKQLAVVCRGRIRRKHGVWNPMSESTITTSCVTPRVGSNIFTWATMC